MVSSGPDAEIEAMVLFAEIMAALLAAILVATTEALSPLAIVVVPPKVLREPPEVAEPTSVIF